MQLRSMYGALLSEHALLTDTALSRKLVQALFTQCDCYNAALLLSLCHAQSLTLFD
jgi:hypothetical protein